MSESRNERPSSDLPHADSDDFSLIVGGPLYRLLVRTDLLVPPVEAYYRWILAGILAAWVPLAVLTAIEGTFASGVKVPFLYDLDNLRFLVALPLMIAAESVSHRRMRSIVAQFPGNNLIAAADRPHFRRLIEQALAMRNAPLAEWTILAIAFASGHMLWSRLSALEVDAWYAVRVGAAHQTTLAGYWLTLVSLPLGRFLLFRWFYRILIWYVFLWRVSRMRLQLNPLHPDRAGGLGFLETTADAFTPLLIAQSTIVAGTIGNQLLYEGKNFLEFKLELAGCAAFLLLLVIFPLFFFVRQMFETRLETLHAYDAFASRYVHEFREKWLEQPAAAQSALGSQDVQALASLSGSFEVVRKMRVVPFDKDMIFAVGMPILLPLLPILLTTIPLNEIAERVVKLLL